MAKALVLHSVYDAEHCVKNSLFKESLLFSTHPSVDVYLKEKYHLESRCLSEFFGIKEIQGYKAMVSGRVDALLQALDRDISPVIAGQHGVKIDYFNSLYAYVGKHHYLGYLVFIEGLRRAISSCQLSRVIFYDRIQIRMSRPWSLLAWMAWCVIL
jgi:hypothetical protein